MSEFEEIKRKIVETLAKMPSGKVGRSDLYRITGGSQDAFNQAFQELINEFSIREATPDSLTSYITSYELTDSGIERYKLGYLVDSSKQPDYITRDDSEYVKVISQDTQYGATTTGVRLARPSSKVAKEKRRGIIFISVIVFVVIAVTTLILIFTL